MAWQEVRKGRGKGGSGLQASLTAMQNSMAQLAASIQNTYTPQGKGGPPQGKGTPKGGGKGNGNGKGGERKAENLRPFSERATRTTEEIQCTGCPTYNWTTRSACRSCGRKLPQGPVPSSQAAPSSCSVASSGLSYASVAKGSSGQADGKEKDKVLLTQKAESLAHILETLPESDPLREEFQNQLEQLRNDLRDPRQPGARLDSAIAKQRKAEAKVQKCKEALKQAEEALHSAQEEKAASDSELKAARAAATPAPPPPEHPQGEPGLTLSSEDMVGLHDMLQQCGLLAVAAQEEAEAAGATEGKRPRVGPYGAPTTPPREKTTVANPALVSKLAASVAYIQKHMHFPGEDKAKEKEKEQEEEKKDGGGLSQEETQAASASANSPPRPRAQGVLQTLSSTPPRSFTVRPRTHKCGREHDPPLPGRQSMQREASRARVAEPAHHCTGCPPRSDQRVSDTEAPIARSGVSDTGRFTRSVPTPSLL